MKASFFIEILYKCLNMLIDEAVLVPLLTT